MFISNHEDADLLSGSLVKVTCLRKGKTHLYNFHSLVQDKQGTWTLTFSRKSPRGIVEWWIVDKGDVSTQMAAFRLVGMNKEVLTNFLPDSRTHTLPCTSFKHRWTIQGDLQLKGIGIRGEHQGDGRVWTTVHQGSILFTGQGDLGEISMLAEMDQSMIPPFDSARDLAEDYAALTKSRKRKGDQTAHPFFSFLENKSKELPLGTLVDFVQFVQSILDCLEEMGYGVPDINLQDVFEELVSKEEAAGALVALATSARKRVKTNEELEQALEEERRAHADTRRLLEVSTKEMLLTEGAFLRVDQENVRLKQMTEDLKCLLAIMKVEQAGLWQSLRDAETTRDHFYQRVRALAEM